MKKEKLEELFFEDLDKRPPEQLLPVECVAMLFSPDDIKINYKKEKILIPGMGWVCAPGIKKIPRVDKESLDWVAITQEDGFFNVLVGFGNPFLSCELPMSNGVVCAMPYSLHNKDTGSFNKFDFKKSS